MPPILFIVLAIYLRFASTLSERPSARAQMKFRALFLMSRSFMVSNIRPVSCTKYLTIFLLGSAILVLRVPSKSKSTFEFILASMLFDIVEIIASALSFLFCQSEWFILGIKSWISSLISPLPWFETMLLFSIALPPFITESLGGFEGGWFPIYFLSFSFDTFFGGGSYFLISSIFPAWFLFIFLSIWAKKSSPIRIFILPIFFTIVSLTSATPSARSFSNRGNSDRSAYLALSGT